MWGILDHMAMDDPPPFISFTSEIKKELVFYLLEETVKCKITVYSFIDLAFLWRVEGTDLRLLWVPFAYMCEFLCRVKDLVSSQLLILEIKVSRTHNQNKSFFPAAIQHQEWSKGIQVNCFWICNSRFLKRRLQSLVLNFKS